MNRGYNINVEFCEKRARQFNTTMPKICNASVEDGGLGFKSDSYWSNIRKNRRGMSTQSIHILSNILECCSEDIILKDDDPKEDDELYMNDQRMWEWHNWEWHELRVINAKLDKIMDKMGIKVHVGELG